MKRYLIAGVIMVAMVACNTDKKSEENTEYKEQIERLDSINAEMDQAQEELDQIKDDLSDVDSLLNELEL